MTAIAGDRATRNTSWVPVAITLAKRSMVGILRIPAAVIPLVVMPMFLFSGTFFPVEALFSGPALWLVQATPLYHAISLIRGLSTGLVGIGQVLDTLYLVVFFVVCIWIAMRQMERKLIK